MRSPRHIRSRRSHIACTLAVGIAAWLAAAAPVGAADPIEDAPIYQLDAVDAVPDAPVGGEPAPAAPAAAAPVAEAPPVVGADRTADDVERDLAGTVEELRRTQARLQARRDELQRRLVSLEQAREVADQRLDSASDRIAGRLVDLLEGGRDARLQALIEVRGTTDAASRAPMVAALAPADRELVEEEASARDGSSRAASQAELVRLDVLALGTRLAAVEAAIAERSGPDAAERARAAGDRFTVDADLVFATGAIPGIGYWGAATGGGSALDGWMGFAGAAVGGVGCTPPDAQLAATGSIEQGEASWYGPGFHGNPTANGEPYDQGAMTAAHRTLPFGTIVRVYSSRTARCAFVRINDRGPFVDGRIIDLSQAAAEAIGMSGVAPVQVEVWAAPATTG